MTVPHNTVDKPKSPISKNVGETDFFETSDFTIGIATTAQINNPYPPSPKIIPKKIRINAKNQPEMSYSKYPGTAPKKSVNG